VRQRSTGRDRAKGEREAAKSRYFSRPQPATPLLLITRLSFAVRFGGSRVIASLISSGFFPAIRSDRAADRLAVFHSQHASVRATRPREWYLEWSLFLVKNH